MFLQMMWHIKFCMVKICPNHSFYAADVPSSARTGCGQLVFSPSRAVALLLLLQAATSAAALALSWTGSGFVQSLSCSRLRLGQPPIWRNRQGRGKKGKEKGKRSLERTLLGFLCFFGLNFSHGRILRGK